MNYAVAVALQNEHLLSRFYTDICAENIYQRAFLKCMGLLGIESAKRLSLRQSNLKASKIVQYPFFGLQYFYRRSKSKNLVDEYSNYIEARKKFNRLIEQDLENDPATHLYAFNTCALDLLKHKDHRKIILEQCSLPAGMYLERICDEEEVYTDWTSGFHRSLLSNPIIQEYIQDELTELKLADKIFSPSHEVTEALCNIQINKEKIFWIPYGYNFNTTNRARTLQARMVVGTVGIVELRKGIHHFAHVAKQCSFADFISIGAIGTYFPVKKMTDFKDHIKFLGHLNRVDLLREYSKMDVLLLLTLGEGSATVIYEALSLGIPVITTKAAGSIIEDGKSGYIVKANDYDAINFRLELLSDKDHYRTMSEEALKRSEFGNRESYCNRLIENLRLS